MALEWGINQGLITASPVDDPIASYNSTVDNQCHSIKVTSPAGTNKITEIGWWCDNATEETNFEVGLYSHNVGNDKPENRLEWSNTNAKGTDAGWKKVAVDWAISAETIYWIAIQVDDTATETLCGQERTDYRRSLKTNIGGLTDPWPASTETTWPYGIYALWEAAATYSELSGDCAGSSSGSGDLELITYSALAGTCEAVSGGSCDLGSVLIHMSTDVHYKRLVASGNNEIWFEDI